MSFTLTNSCLVPVLLIWTVYFTEQAWFENEGGNFLPDGWWKFTDGHIAILESLAPTLVKQFHEGTHSGWTALKTTLAQHFYIPKLCNINKTVCERYSLCVRNNTQQGPRCKYILVFVCIFSGLVEAFPTQTEKAWKVARCLLKEIIPWFGIPVYWVRQWAVFVAEVVQLMAKGLGITWKLHTAYHPHSMGKVECISRTLNLQLGKLCQETQP
jgi:hypothetical protein